MKEGEIAVVVARVINVKPLALASYDFWGPFRNAALVFNETIALIKLSSTDQAPAYCDWIAAAGGTAGGSRVPAQ